MSPLTLSHHPLLAYCIFLLKTFFLTKSRTNVRQIILPHIPYLPLQTSYLWHTVHSTFTFLSVQPSQLKISANLSFSSFLNINFSTFSNLKHAPNLLCTFLLPLLWLFSPYTPFPLFPIPPSTLSLSLSLSPLHIPVCGSPQCVVSILDLAGCILPHSQNS